MVVFRYTKVVSANQPKGPQFAMALPVRTVATIQPSNTASGGGNRTRAWS
jgi:hypothetical protein